MALDVASCSSLLQQEALIDSQTPLNLGIAPLSAQGDTISTITSNKSLMNFTGTKDVRHVSGKRTINTINLVTRSGVDTSHTKPKSCKSPSKSKNAHLKQMCKNHVSTN